MLFLSCWSGFSRYRIYLFMHINITSASKSATYTTFSKLTTNVDEHYKFATHIITHHSPIGFESNRVCVDQSKFLQTIRIPSNFLNKTYFVHVVQRVHSHHHCSQHSSFHTFLFQFKLFFYHAHVSKQTIKLVQK